MKAVNHYLIIKKDKVKPKKVGGLILTEKLDEDNRYLKAKVISVGENIDLSDTILTNEKIAKLNFLNSKLYEDKNNIFLKSSFELQILDRKKFYNKFVVAKANRVDLETINFDLIINLTKNNIKIVNIVIPELKGDVPNEKLDNLIYEFNSGGIKVSNWIELKNFTNLIISSYAG